MIIDINISWLMMSVCITPCDIITLRGITWKEIHEKSKKETIGRLFLWQMLEAVNEWKGVGLQRAIFDYWLCVWRWRGWTDVTLYSWISYEVLFYFFFCLRSVFTFAWPFGHRELHRVLETHKTPKSLCCLLVFKLHHKIFEYRVLLSEE